MKNLCTRDIEVELPIYLPDATLGMVKAIDGSDLYSNRVRGVVVNTYHLMNTPTTPVLKKHGGIKGFMGFNGLVVSDSGGWQVFSLIKRHGTQGSISDEGVLFSLKSSRNTLFTPEKSIQVQFEIGSDIIICLDDFASNKSTHRQTKQVVDRTIRWAKRSKQEYIRLCEKNGLSEKTRPLLFCVIQGGFEKDLRKKCAEELIKIGFDGFGFGGYVIDEKTQKMDLEIAQYTANLIPNDKYKFALGVGKPEDIVACHKFGWKIFDCTLPTRDARHHRLYKTLSTKDFSKYEYVYINKQQYKTDTASIDNTCDCLTCRNYSRAYLHHLFKVKDTLAFRLATVHNLRFYTRLTESLM